MKVERLAMVRRLFFVEKNSQTIWLLDKNHETIGGCHGPLVQLKVAHGKMNYKLINFFLYNSLNTVDSVFWHFNKQPYYWPCLPCVHALMVVAPLLFLFLL